MSDPDVATEYLALVEAILGAEDVIAAGMNYQTRFQNETRRLGEELFLLLDKLFADIEVATDDAHLIADHPDMYISRKSLISSLQQSAEKLKRIANLQNPSS